MQATTRLNPSARGLKLKELLLSSPIEIDIARTAFCEV